MVQFDIKEIQNRIAGTSSEVIRSFIPITERAKVNDTVYDFAMSDEIIDRHGTVVKLGGGANIEQYKTNPVVLWMHESSKGMFSESYNPDLILGYGEPFFKNGKLMNKIHFESESTTGNTLAEKVVKKIEFGSIRAGSIGFIPISGSYGEKDMGEDEEIFYIRDWTLLEYSIVTIPSNPNALVENNWDAISRAEEEQIDQDLNKIIEEKSAIDLPTRNKSKRARHYLKLIN